MSVGDAPITPADRANYGEQNKDRLARKRGKQDLSEGDDGFDESGEIKDNTKLFPNYKPPRRLLALEIIVIILLVMLLLINPNGFTAISLKGTDTVGLLSMSPSSYSVQY
jgi:hypothetical protein